MKRKMTSNIGLILGAAAAALALSTVACSGGDPSANTPSTQGPSAAPHGESVAAHYDGETVFRGVYLGQGAVAAMLPELRDPALAAEAQKLTKEQLATQLKGAAEHLRAQTKAESTAEGLDKLAAKLSTGEVTPEQLIAARRDFSTAFGDNVVARIGASDPSFFARFGADLQSGEHLRIQRSLEDGAKTFLAAASAEGGVGGHVVQERMCIIVVVAYAAVYAWTYFWLPQDGVAGAQGDLRQAALVDTIATRLATH